MSAPDGDTIPVGVLYDFSSAMCFVAHEVMVRLEPRVRDIGVELRWSPIDLVRLTAWTRGKPYSQRARGRVLGVAESLDVSIPHPPRWWMDSRPASAVALELRDDPAREARYRAAVWEAIYRGGACLDDPGTLENVVEEASLEMDLPEEEAALETVDAVTREAQALGVVGVPSFLLGEWPVGGIQEDDTMMHFLKRYADRVRSGEIAPQAH